MAYGGAWGLSSSDPGALITPGQNGSFDLQHNVGSQANMSGLDGNGVLGALGQIPGWSARQDSGLLPTTVTPAQPQASSVQQPPIQAPGANNSRVPVMTPDQEANKTALEQGDRWSPVGTATGPTHDQVIQGTIDADLYKNNYGKKFNNMGVPIG